MRLSRVLRALRSDRRAQTDSAARVAAPAGARPILVGVHGSAASIRALEWAAIRAWAGHTSLHVVHALEVRVWLVPEGLGVWWVSDPGEDAFCLLDAAIERARKLVPGLEVTSSLRGVGASAALLDEGHDAALIVLGSGRSGHRPAWFRPGVTSRVARRALSPVVVVGPDHEVLL